MRNVRPILHRAAEIDDVADLDDMALVPATSLPEKPYWRSRYRFFQSRPRASAARIASADHVGRNFEGLVVDRLPRAVARRATSTSRSAECDPEYQSAPRVIGNPTSVQKAGPPQPSRGVALENELDQKPEGDLLAMVVGVCAVATVNPLCTAWAAANPDDSKAKARQQCVGLDQTFKGRGDNLDFHRLKC